MELRARIPYDPHIHQAAIHAGLERNRFGVLVCHRRFGKTVCAVNTLLDAALQFPLERGRFGYVAPYLKQATQIAWGMLQQYAGALIATGQATTNEQDKTLTLWNGASIRLYGADNPDAMRGLYFDGVVVDEVADVKPNVWGEILRPALADRKGWALFIGTPKGINLFSELYEYARTHEGWFAGLYRADETNLPWLDEEELRLAKEAMPDNAYRQEFLCDFNASSDNALITIDMVTAGIHKGKGIQQGHIEGLPVVFGLDVARFGSDRTVLFRRQGHMSFTPLVWQGLDNMQVVGRVANLIHEHRPEAVFIDVGGGQGVIDRLRQLGYDQVVEVNFGSKSDDPLCINKRTEMWWTMAQWLRDGGGLPDTSDLKTDLCGPTYDYDAANRVRLESKDKIKERGLRSPDLGDALALTFAYPVAARKAQHYNHDAHAQIAKTDYDLLAYR